MVDLYYRPLNGLALNARRAAKDGEAAVHVWELPRRRMITLRLDPSDQALVAKVEGVIGLSLPTQPNRLSASANPDDDAFVLWMSPDEFMIDVPFQGLNGADTKMLADLIAAVQGDFALVADVSDQMAGIGLGGPDWRNVWSKLCALDMDASVFEPGQCGQTLAAKCNIAFYAPDTQAESVEQLRLYTRRSFSRYLFERLEDAGLEYGISLKAI